MRPTGAELDDLPAVQFSPVDSVLEMWEHRAMPKDRNKTYSDHQAEASRLQKQREAAKKQPPKRKTTRRGLSQVLPPDSR
jgi:hypothetical protein